ncbi:MAG TPA: ATP-binding protein [Vicinamibacterales bacterium]|nr:ATP-binding protein [Vicinamibacterales bacterium]
MSAVSARTSSINACIPTTVLWFAQRSKRPLKTDMVTMLRRMIGEDIELATTLAAGLTQVRADRSQLEQVVMNLVINARDACGPGGKIRLVTEAADIDGPIAGLTPGLNRGAYVALSVIDNGTGLNEATKSRLFEPSSRQATRAGHRSWTRHGLRHRGSERWGDSGRERARARIAIHCFPAS